MLVVFFSLIDFFGAICTLTFNDIPHGARQSSYCQPTNNQWAFFFLSFKYCIWLCRPFDFIASETLNYLVFQSQFDFERTWWMLSQKCVVRTKLDTCVYLRFYECVKNSWHDRKRRCLRYNKHLIFVSCHRLIFQDGSYIIWCTHTMFPL